MEPFLCASLRAVSSTEVVGTKAPPTGQTRMAQRTATWLGDIKGRLILADLRVPLGAWKAA